MASEKVTLTALDKKKKNQEKIVMLTAYDYSFAKVIDEAGADTILVGDSLGNVMQGMSSTVSVTVDHIVYHIQCVRRAVKKALLIGDMPFMSYATTERALNCAEKFMQAGAEMVKMEGGAWLCDTIKLLADNGVPTCGHLGLQPQSVNFIGGYRVQGRDKTVAKRMLEDAKALQQAGARMLVLECVPSLLAEEITNAVSIPVIGIGAGLQCDGQVLVCYDMLGIGKHPLPTFVKNFMQGQDSIPAAVQAYVNAVKEKEFPEAKHGFE